MGGAIGDGECWREQGGAEEGKPAGDQQAPRCRARQPDDAEAEDAVQGDPLARERSAEEKAGHEEEEPSRECTSRSALQPRHKSGRPAKQEGEQVDVIHADAALHKSGPVEEGEDANQGGNVTSFSQQPS